MPGGPDVSFPNAPLRHAPGVAPLGVTLSIGAATREVRARVILAGSSAEAYED